MRTFLTCCIHLLWFSLGWCSQMFLLAWAVFTLIPMVPAYKAPPRSTNDQTFQLGLSRIVVLLPQASSTDIYWLSLFDDGFDMAIVQMKVLCSFHAFKSMCLEELTSTGAWETNFPGVLWLCIKSASFPTFSGFHTTHRENWMVMWTINVSTFEDGDMDEVGGEQPAPQTEVVGSQHRVWFIAQT